MMSKLVNPTAVSFFGLILSVALGVALSWRALEPVLVASASVPPVQKRDVSVLRAKGWDFWTIEIENLAHELKEEKLRLQKQAELLEQRSARIAAEEKELARVRANLEALRKEIGGRLVEISADEAKNLRTLAQTYASLTPRAAVAILRELDDTTAVKILSLMKPDAVGPIFEEMSKPSAEDANEARRAALLSERLRLLRANRTTSS